ncbi:MAG: hypothetical protein ACLQNE_45565 [Thermoguttaceae bacterium]|jgi:hypothetical protein
MPAEFKKMGIAFQYPENWTLDEEDAVAGNQSVTVHTPGGGLWSVSVHPRSMDPAQLATAALDAMKDEYEGLEVEEARETIAGHELAGYDFNFFYLDLTNTAAVRCIRTHRATYSIFVEAEDREFDRVRRVFEAMTTSLLQAMK